METTEFHSFPSCLLMFLPYLWGMETYSDVIVIWICSIGSYRTYEEWKLLANAKLSYSMDGSYRTYEEWKLHNLLRVSLCMYVLTVPMRNGNNPCSSKNLATNSGSYRTYEEWKLRCEMLYRVQSLQVLTVPMRNGNMLYNLGIISRKTVVLTVPMRNGNAVIAKAHIYRAPSSYRTYEEWKPR